MQPHMGVITTLCLSQLTDGTDCTAEEEVGEEEEGERAPAQPPSGSRRWKSLDGCRRRAADEQETLEATF